MKNNFLTTRSVNIVIVVEEVYLSRFSFGHTYAHLLITFLIYIKLEVLNDISRCGAVTYFNNLSILMYLSACYSINVRKGDFLKCHHILTVFNQHEKEIIFFRFLILKETMKFFIVPEH